MTLAAGTRLGPYEIVATIGAGGMGRVYRARDTRLGREVAIKVSDERFTDRFAREARTVAALNHPNICTLHDVGPNYLVMELVDGPTLADRIATNDIPLPEALEIARQVAAALEEAHRMRVLHRDLKPGNVMLDARRGPSKPVTIKVLDFGLAKLADGKSDATMTAIGTVMGTPAYMAPEQVQGRQIDERSEVFSFGAMLYEMLARRPAFDGDTVSEVLNAVLRAEPSMSQAPPAIERIVRRCLHKEPGRRFQTMAEVRTALEAAGDSLHAESAKTQPSIAVLPFADMSPAKDHEWFSDGLSEEIINALAQVSGLKVIARTSAFAFKDKPEDVRQIAEALGVANVLEGSVRKAGNRIRVTAQLIAAADGSHLWSERYDRDLIDVFEIQDEVARAIAAVLQVKLSTREGYRRHTPSLAAYEMFLKARHHMFKMTPESLHRARDLFEQTIALDPAFALPHIELGACYMMLVIENAIAAREGSASIRTAGRRVLELDPSLSEAHALLALASDIDYDWREADREYDAAVARGQVSVMVRYFYSVHLAVLGRTEECEEQMRRMIEEDPLNLFYRTAVALIHVGLGKEEQGVAEARQVLELDDRVWIPYLWLCAHQARRGQLDEALVSARKAYALVPWNSFAIGLLAGLLNRLGETASATDVRKQLGNGDGFGMPAGFVSYYMMQGELDAAADWFEKAIAQRDFRAPWILPRVFGDQLVTSPRWPRLAKLMNLP